jgi:hypothetical protein
MIQSRKKLFNILFIFTLFHFQTVSSQRVIVSLGKRIQQHFSGNKQHIKDSYEGEKSYDDSVSRRNLAAATTLLLVVLGYYTQKRFAGGGEFCCFTTCLTQPF